MDIGAGYTAYDITSSGLNCPYEPQDEPNRHRVGQNLWADNFGMIQVDWTKPDPTVDLEIHNGQGEVAMTKHLTLANLRPK
jgi:alkaline phosphatase D